jgi:hypothetical protein
MIPRLTSFRGVVENHSRKSTQTPINHWRKRRKYAD